MLETVRTLSTRAWTNLAGLVPTQLDILGHLTAADDDGGDRGVSASARDLLARTLGRLTEDARSAAATRAQEAAFDLAAALARRPLSAPVGSGMGRLQAALELIRNVEDSRQEEKKKCSSDLN